MPVGDVFFQALEIMHTTALWLPLEECSFHGSKEKRGSSSISPVSRGPHSPQGISSLSRGILANTAFSGCKEEGGDRGSIPRQGLSVPG